MAINDKTVLAMTMRPRDFDAVIGLEKPIALIKTKIDSGEIPRAILIRGPYGTGKTTLAHIIARYVQGPFFEGQPEIHEVNAANYRKIENMRVLSEEATKYPMPPSIYRVIILDECHKLTGDSQDILLKELEVPRSSTIWILGTTDPEKLNQGVRDRCFPLETEPMNAASRHTLIQRAVENTHYSDLDEVKKFEALITKFGVESPRRILGAFELMKNGLDAETACTSISVSITPEYNDIAFSAVFGNWFRDTVLWGKVPVRATGALLRDLEDKLTCASKKEDNDEDQRTDEEGGSKTDAAHALRGILAAYLKGRCLPKALKDGKYKFPTPQESERARKAMQVLGNTPPPEAFEMLWSGTIIAICSVNAIMQEK